MCPEFRFKIKHYIRPSCSGKPHGFFLIILNLIYWFLPKEGLCQIKLELVQSCGHYRANRYTHVYKCKQFLS